MLALRFPNAAFAHSAAATLIVGVGLISAVAFAASTTPYSIGSSTFVDLGPAPAVIEASSGPIDIVIADAQPSVPTIGHWVGANTPFVAPAADAASHVWAVAYCCSSVVTVSVTPISNAIGGTSNAAAGAYVDGWNVTLGAKADAANAATDTTPISAMAALKQISKSNQATAAALAALPQAAAGADASGTIATGGTAQALFGGATPVNGFAVYNPNLSDDCWISASTTAAANGAGSVRLVANGGGYETPANLRPFHAVSIVCPTTGDAFTAIKW